MDHTFPSEKRQVFLVKPRGYDGYELKLGDIMRGERATMGKSLLDVQRDLHIKVAYISAIENCDAEAFDTPGFIPGYVRSYAKYLGMCPDDVFNKFCAESDYFVPHGMSSAASVRSGSLAATVKTINSDQNEALFLNSTTTYLPVKESAFEKIEARAVASIAVLAVLIAGLSYGGWSVLKEIQQVQMAPVEVTPFVMAEIDPITKTYAKNSVPVSEINSDNSVLETFDRLYSPKALDVPIMISRETSIAMLDPSTYGNFKPEITPPRVGFENILSEPNLKVTSALGATEIINPVPRVSEVFPSQIALFAVRDAWVSVKTSDGTRIFEKTMMAGDEFILPKTEVPPELRAGMSGSIYFAIDGELYGPAGTGTRVVKNITLSKETLMEAYRKADLDQDPELIQVATAAKVSSFTIDKVSD
mgnify:CR=1 FL=1